MRTAYLRFMGQIFIRADTLIAWNKMKVLICNILNNNTSKNLLYRHLT
jgi:hypothetical protein